MNKVANVHVLGHGFEECFKLGVLGNVWYGFLGSNASNSSSGDNGDDERMVGDNEKIMSDDKKDGEQ
jgi:hypothetical protein